MTTWKIVPGWTNAAMRQAMRDALPGVSGDILDHALKVALDAAPPDPNESMTAEEARDFQAWKGLDAAIAFHLIERHANGWADVGNMMNAWLEANDGRLSP